MVAISCPEISSVSLRHRERERQRCFLASRRDRYPQRTGRHAFGHRVPDRLE